MDTSASLLESLRDASNETAWNRLFEMYAPLLRNWLRRHNANAGDIDDVVQEVMTVVIRRFPEFQHHSRKGAFRSWLRTITVNCLRDQWRRNNKHPRATGGTDCVAAIEQLADPSSGISRVWDREHDEHVASFLLAKIQSDFSPQTWLAFRRFAIDGMSADEVGEELGITANAVFIAKSRVMAGLRKQAQGLIE